MTELPIEQHVHRALEEADRVCVLAQSRVRYSAGAVEARGGVDEISAHYLGHTASGESAGSPADSNGAQASFGAKTKD